MATVERTTTTTSRPYGGKSPEERRAERRHRILDAGLEVFGSAGYATSTVDELCRVAGIGPKHFYEQFESREALLVAVYERVVADLTGAVEAALGAASTEDLEARIGGAIGAFLHAYLDDPRVAQVGCIEVVGAGPVLEQRRRAAIDSFARLMSAEARAAGVVRDQAFTDTITVALVGGANELIIDWLFSPTRRRPSRHHLAHALTQLILVATLIEPPVAPARRRARKQARP